MKLHLIDGTYELFRAHFGHPSVTAPDGREVGAVRGLIQSLLALLRQEAVSHVACAFDRQIESFRNELFDGYKTGEDVPAELMAQFGLAERAASTLGIVVWPMIEFEADDAIATAATRWAGERRMEQVVICSPDKDLMQVVREELVVCLDRRRGHLYNEEAVRAKLGVAPRSIPDYLALVGDAADGIPGIPRWGAKSAATVLVRYPFIEEIPDDASAWGVNVRGAKALSESLAKRRDEASLYKRLATLRLDVPLEQTLQELKWRGVNRPEYQSLCAELGFAGLLDRPHRWAEDQG